MPVVCKINKKSQVKNIHEFFALLASMMSLKTLNNQPELRGYGLCPSISSHLTYLQNSSSHLTSENVGSADISTELTFLHAFIIIN